MVLHKAARRAANGVWSVPERPNEHESESVDQGTLNLGGVAVRWDVLRLTYSRSSGPGGQNVNKRATKATLRVSVGDLPIPNDAKDRLRARAGQLLTDGDELVISNGRRRTQERNKSACLERLGELIAQARVRPKTRKKTKPSRGAVERRLKEKKTRSDSKKRRNWKPD